MCVPELRICVYHMSDCVAWLCSEDKSSLCAPLATMTSGAASGTGKLHVRCCHTNTKDGVSSYILHVEARGTNLDNKGAPWEQQRHVPARRLQLRCGVGSGGRGRGADAKHTVEKRVPFPTEVSGHGNHRLFLPPTLLLH